MTNGSFPYEEGIEELSELYYRGYVPFLISPDYYWTYGSVAVSDRGHLTYRHPNCCWGLWLQARYCAVLFDKANLRRYETAVANRCKGSDPLATASVHQRSGSTCTYSPDTATGAG